MMIVSRFRRSPADSPANWAGGDSSGAGLLRDSSVGGGEPIVDGVRTADDGDDKARDGDGVFAVEAIGDVGQGDIGGVVPEGPCREGHDSLTTGKRATVGLEDG